MDNIETNTDNTRLYETIFLSRQDISKDQVDTLTQNWVDIITNNNGHVGLVKQWGIMNLEYPIKKNKRAYFTLINIEANKDVIYEMERQMRINADVIRYMTVKVEKHNDTPSIMIKEQEE